MGSAVGDVDDIDFEDLTSPRLTDVQRRILEFTEAKRVELDIDRMLAEAVEAAGVGDHLDDTDGFAGRLSAHAAAIEADAGLTQLTRASLRQRVVRLLRNRLSLTELIKRHPEIESIPIEKPFIVVGMPRSGTTHLVNLIAGVDPRYARAKSEHDDSWPAPRWWPRCTTGSPRRSRRKSSSSTSTWPHMCWNGMRACPIGTITTWASTKPAATHT